MATAWSQTWTFLDGEWREGNIPLMGVRTHAAWLGSSVFDGARVFEGRVPDLDRHCARINASATAMGLRADVSVETWMGLVAEGRKHFAPDAALYVRPMVWAEQGGLLLVAADPESTRWCLSLYEAPMRAAVDGFSVTLSPFRKPSQECAPTNAKAGCLYPNNGRMLVEARARGFDNCIVRDLVGNVAELATANLFMGKDGIVFTPAVNGQFLNGITRQRTIALLREAGVTVVETALSYRDFQDADEIFSSGNYSKVMPVNRIDDRPLQPGPLFRRARELYWDFAHG